MVRSHELELLSWVHEKIQQLDRIHGNTIHYRVIFPHLRKGTTLVIQLQWLVTDERATVPHVRKGTAHEFYPLSGGNAA